MAETYIIHREIARRSRDWIIILLFDYILSDWVNLLWYKVGWCIVQITLLLTSLQTLKWIKFLRIRIAGIYGLKMWDTKFLIYFAFLQLIQLSLLVFCVTWHRKFGLFFDLCLPFRLIMGKGQRYYLREYRWNIRVQGLNIFLIGPNPS